MLLTEGPIPACKSNEVLPPKDARNYHSFHFTRQLLDFPTQETLNLNAKLIIKCLVFNFLALAKAYVFAKYYHSEKSFCSVTLDAILVYSVLYLMIHYCCTQMHQHRNRFP